MIEISGQRERERGRERLFSSITVGGKYMGTGVVSFVLVFGLQLCVCQCCEHSRRRESERLLDGNVMEMWKF